MELYVLSPLSSRSFSFQLFILRSLPLNLLPSISHFSQSLHHLVISSFVFKHLSTVQHCCVFLDPSPQSISPSYPQFHVLSMELYVLSPLLSLSFSSHLFIFPSLALHLLSSISHRSQSLHHLLISSFVFERLSTVHHCCIFLDPSLHLPISISSSIVIPVYLSIIYTASPYTSPPISHLPIDCCLSFSVHLSISFHFYLSSTICPSSPYFQLLLRTSLYHLITAVSFFLSLSVSSSLSIPQSDSP